MAKAAYLRIIISLLLIAAIAWGAVRAFSRWKALEGEVLKCEHEIDVLRSDVTAEKDASVGFNAMDGIQLEGRFDDLLGEVNALQFQALDFARTTGTTTTLDPSEKGFGCLNTDTGKFLLACDDVQPYLDGQKLKVRIGNPNAASYSGFTLNVKWGQKEPEPPSMAEDNNKWVKDYKEWKREDAKWMTGLQSKEISFTDNLKAGTWHSVDLVLSPAGSGDLGYIEIGMVAPVVSLTADDLDNQAQ
jgi:hypothetical protein